MASWAHHDDTSGCERSKMISSAMHNIMIKHGESLKNETKPNYTVKTIGELWDLFCSNKLSIFGNAQRGIKVTTGWAEQFLYTIINFPTTVPAITLRKVYKRECVDGAERITTVYHVTDGAQRLTSIMMFLMGLIQVRIIRLPARRSERLLKKRKASAALDLTDGPVRQFYACASDLVAGTGFPMVYKHVKDDDYDVDYSALCADSAGDNIKDFFYHLRMSSGHGFKHHIQTHDSQFMHPTGQTAFCSTAMNVIDTEFTQKAASLVNVYQSAQQFFCEATELVCLIGDNATEWLKRVVDPVLAEITGQWGVGYKSRASFGALVQALLITQGSEFVPSIEDKSMWALVLNDLISKYMDEELSPEVKRRFLAAVRLFPVLVQPHKRSKLTPDDVAITVAWIYEAVNAARLPDEENPVEYPSDLISESDKATVAKVFKVVKASSQKNKLSVLKLQFDGEAASRPRLWAMRLASALAVSQRHKDQRNLADFVAHLKKGVSLDTIPREDDDEEDQEDQEQSEDNDTDGSAICTRLRSRKKAPPVEDTFDLNDLGDFDQDPEDFEDPGDPDDHSYVAGEEEEVADADEEEANDEGAAEEAAADA